LAPSRRAPITAAGNMPCFTASSTAASPPSLITEGGVGYLKPVGRPTRAQEDELCRQMDGVVGFTSVDSRSQRNKKKGDKVQKVNKDDSGCGINK